MTLYKASIPSTVMHWNGLNPLNPEAQRLRETTRLLVQQTGQQNALKPAFQFVRP